MVFNDIIYSGNTYKKMNQKDRKVEWEELIKLLKKVVVKIDTQKYKAIYGIPRGGIVIAVVLSHMINKPIILKLEKKIEREILIVDDIVDSGETLKTAKTLYPNTDFLSLFVKEKTPLLPDYYGEVVPQHLWVVFPWEYKIKNR